MQLQEKVIVDTGFILALFNEEDEYYEVACNVAEKIDHYCWYTTHFVLHEIFWIMKKKNVHKAIACFEIIHDYLILPEFPSDWHDQILPILKKYADKKLDLTDASLIVLADHLKLGQIVSVDKRDFSFLRWNAGKNKFVNLLHV